MDIYKLLMQAKAESANIAPNIPGINRTKSLASIALNIDIIYIISIREYLTAEDGGLIVMDWLYVYDKKDTCNSDTSNDDKPTIIDAPIVVIVPGICNTSQSTYIRLVIFHSSNLTKTHLIH
jgi:predicted alpha/beta-fold hydrolase